MTAHELESLHATHTHERTYPVDRRTVYEAWVDRDTKATWFAPTAHHYELDVRVGGDERLLAEVDGADEVEFRATYLDVVPQRRLVASSTLRPEGRLSTAAIQTVEFNDDGEGGTLLTVTEQATYVDAFEQPEWRRQGVSDQLDALGSVLLDGGEAVA